MRKGPVRSTIEKGISTPHALRQAAQDPHPRNQPTPRRRHHRAREAQQLRIPVPQRQGGVRTSFAPRLAATCEESRGAEERDPARPKTDTIEKSYRCVSLKGRAHAITCKTRWILNCMLSPVVSHYRILGALAWRIKNAFPSWSRLAKKNLLLRRRVRSGTNKTCEGASIARPYRRQVCGFGNQLANNRRQAQNLPPEHGVHCPR